MYTFQLLAEMRQAQSGSLPSAPPILPTTGHDYPLSFAQQRLWFLHQLEPDSPAYNMPMSAHLSGKLDQVALAQTMATIINRHQVLRVTFAEAEGQPVQVIHPEITFEFGLCPGHEPQFDQHSHHLRHPLIDLSHLPEAAQQAEVTRLATADVHRPFDLSQTLPLRLMLIRLAETEHVFCW